MGSGRLLLLEICHFWGSIIIFKEGVIPRCSMVLVYIYIYLHNWVICRANVGKYSVHGAYG